MQLDATIENHLVDSAIEILEPEQQPEVENKIPPVVIGSNRNFFDTRKYANIWNILKIQGFVDVCILNPNQKATVIRGVSQLKNLDTAWKYASDSNYSKRIKVTTVENDNSNHLYLKLELTDSFKYRSKSL